MMTYFEFGAFLETECMYETTYKDSEGRTILVITLMDAFQMVNDAIKKEKNVGAT